jgi:purine nucleosidase
MCAVLYPESMKACSPFYCDIDISNGLGYGCVLVYEKEETKNKANAEVCSELHATMFKEYIYRTLCQN